MDSRLISLSKEGRAVVYEHGDRPELIYQQMSVYLSTNLFNCSGPRSTLLSVSMFVDRLIQCRCLSQELALQSCTQVIFKRLKWVLILLKNNDYFSLN